MNEKISNEELAALRERLAVAETVCMLFSWTAAANDSDVDKALEQAWHDWNHAYRPLPRATPSDPEWAVRITELARRRDEIRTTTLAKIRGEIPLAADLAVSE